jgi:hypothetical protein
MVTLWPVNLHLISYQCWCCECWQYQSNYFLTPDTTHYLRLNRVSITVSAEAAPARIENLLTSKMNGKQEHVVGTGDTLAEL